MKELSELLPQPPELTVNIEIIKVIADIEQLLMIMLAGDVDQPCSQLPGQTGGDRLIVNVRFGSPFPGQNTTDDAGRPIFERMLTEQIIHFSMIGANGKNRLNPRLLAVVAHPGGCTSSSC